MPGASLLALPTLCVVLGIAAFALASQLVNLERLGKTFRADPIDAAEEELGAHALLDG